MEEKVLNKVVFHYSDGSYKFIEGDELERWGGMNRQVAIFCMVHQANPRWEDVKWTIVEKDQQIEEKQEDTNEEIISAVS